MKQLSFLYICILFFASVIITVTLFRLPILQSSHSVNAVEVPVVPSVAPHPSTVPTSPSAPTPTPVPEPTEEPTTEPTPTAEPTPTVVPTNSPQPSSTPAPTAPASAEPTPQPTVPSTDDPGRGGNGGDPDDLDNSDSGPNPKQTSISVSGPECGDSNMEVSFKITENDQPRADVPVTFTYNGEQRTVRRSDNQGIARVSYVYQSQGTVRAQPDNDYPWQEAHIQELNCDSAQLGTAQTGNAVLGASTTQLADASPLPVGVELFTAIGTLLSLSGIALKWIRV